MKLRQLYKRLDESDYDAALSVVTALQAKRATPVTVPAPTQKTKTKVHKQITVTKDQHDLMRRLGLII